MPPSPVLGGVIVRTSERGGAAGGVDVGGGGAVATGVCVGVCVAVGVGVGEGVGVGGAQLIVTSSGPTFPGWSADTVTAVATRQDAVSVRVTVSSSDVVSLSRTAVSMAREFEPCPLTAARPDPSHFPATWFDPMPVQLVTVRALPARFDLIVREPSSSSAVTVIVTGCPGWKVGTDE